MFTIFNKALANSQNNGFVNVKLFGAVGDGVADDTAAIALAFASSSSSTIFFPQGTYKTSSTLTLPVGSINLVGESGTHGNYAPKSTNIAYTGTGYAFDINRFSETNLTVKNMTFDGVNGFDLRSGSNVIAAMFNFSFCNFVSVASTYGVAINSINTDFSTIDQCNFYLFQGLCAIRCTGWFNITNISNSKNSTQLHLTNNIFALSIIAISVDLVDSVDIANNDIAVGCTVDVGGKYYQAYIVANSVTQRMYHYNADNPSTVWGSDFYGIGWASNVTIIDNHFEAMNANSDYAISVYGANRDYMRSTVVKNNNFASYGAAEKCILLQRTYATNIIENKLDAQAYTGAIFCNYTTCQNLDLRYNKIYANSGVTVSTPFVDTSPNYTVYKRNYSYSGDIVTGSSLEVDPTNPAAPTTITNILAAIDALPSLKSVLNNKISVSQDDAAVNSYYSVYTIASGELFCGKFSVSIFTMGGYASANYLINGSVITKLNGSTLSTDLITLEIVTGIVKVKYVFTTVGNMRFSCFYDIIDSV